MRAEFKALEILYGVTVWVASCRGARVVSGQTVCHGGPEKPCYKIAYFSEVSSRVAFWEAQQVCEVDSGSLLSLENVAEQEHIEQLLKNLSRTSSGPGIADGDFWIGLTRVDSGSPGEYASYTSCPDLYRWTDGSVSQFRKWYVDEPSCGGEACVVMYHQPSAQLGLGGPYLYQWNDDRCNMKHNFICKYEPARLKSSSFTSISCVTEKPEKGKVLKTSLWRKTAPVLKNELTPSDQSDARIHQCCGINVVNTESHLVKEHGDRPARGHAEHEEQTKSPDVHDEKSLHVTVAGHSSVLLIYVIIPTIPLLLLILVASGTCCFQMLSKRRPRTKTSVDQSTLWISKAAKSDSAMEV